MSAAGKDNAVFEAITPAMAARMQALEAMDAADRSDGTPHAKRLRQIPPETGRFLAILAASAPAGNLVEVGTSAGYSALWLSLACRARGDVLWPCAAQLAGRLVPGGILTADNVISHAHEIPGVAERILADPRLDGVVVPIGSGVLLARRRA